MSRHRNVRNPKIRDDDYDDDYDDYGRSVEEDYGTSPSASQFMYRRNDAAREYPETVDEEMDESPGMSTSNVQTTHSNNYNLRTEDKKRLVSCVEYIESCTGEAFSRAEMEDAAVSADFNAERALNFLLDNGAERNTRKLENPAQKPPVPHLTKRLEGLSVSPDCSAEPARKARKVEKLDPLPRRIRMEEDPTLTTNLSQKPSFVSKQVVLPDWVNSFIGKINEQNSTAAQELQKRMPVNQQKPTMNRVGSNPDFTKPKTTERSNPPTPAPGSPKSKRKGSQGSSPSPAATPTPGSPKSFRKAGRPLSKGDEAVPADLPVTKPERSAKQAARIATLYEQRVAATKPLINLIVIGHVDAGKSTLMGHLLYRLGKVDARQMQRFEHEAKKIGKSSFLYAWVLDETGEERKRGVTIDIAQTSFETPARMVNLMDAPGHKDFIPNMITGAAQADAALLVVDATRGEFETGFESGGQTREHTLLARSLGVTQIAVVVNKMDTVDWSEERFRTIMTELTKFLKSTGYKEADISFVPCSGFSGENLTTSPDSKSSSQAAWWKGPTLLDVIDSFRPPTRLIDRPFRQMVTDVFKSATGGVAVSGRIESGHVEAGDKVIVMPANIPATVKTVLLDAGHSGNAFAGDIAMVDLANIDPLNIHPGDVLCDPYQPVPLATTIRARIVLFAPKMPLLAGQEISFHNQSLTESCIVKKLVSQINKNTGEVIRKSPRALTKHTSGEVELAFQRPICLDLYSASRDLGRFMLRDSGSTIAAGLVTQIIS